jgi:hypothetical protein
MPTLPYILAVSQPPSRGCCTLAFGWRAATVRTVPRNEGPPERALAQRLIELSQMQPAPPVATAQCCLTWQAVSAVSYSANSS